MFTRNRFAAAVAVLGLTGLGVMAAPSPAQAWWAHGGWGWGGLHVGIALPPIVIAPPYYSPPPVAYYPPPPVYYVPRPGPVWVRPNWRNGYWVPGHWS